MHVLHRGSEEVTLTSYGEDRWKLSFPYHYSKGWACQRGTLPCWLPGPPTWYPELTTNISNKVKNPFISIPDQPHLFHSFPRSTPIMTFRPCFYTLTLHRHPHSPGPQTTHTQHCLLGEEWFCVFQDPWNTFSLHRGDPELHVDRAWVAGEIPGYSFKV